MDWKVIDKEVERTPSSGVTWCESQKEKGVRKEKHAMFGDRGKKGHFEETNSWGDIPEHPCNQAEGSFETII